MSHPAFLGMFANKICAVIFVAGLDLQDFPVFCDQLKLAVRLRAEFPFRRRNGRGRVEDI